MLRAAPYPSQRFVVGGVVVLVPGAPTLAGAAAGLAEVTGAVPVVVLAAGAAATIGFTLPSDEM